MDEKVRGESSGNGEDAVEARSDEESVAPPADVDPADHPSNPDLVGDGD